MQGEDPFLWLEDIDGDAALAWVREQNRLTDEDLAQSPTFATLRDDLRAIYDSPAKIPGVVQRGDWYYNFWSDAEHPRGLWRRTTPAEYRKPEPRWDVLLDVDALNAAEGENWVWHGASVLRPDYRHALIALSRGGADADVTREFDMETRSWVVDGFQRPEAKGSLSWIDRDTVFVATDFGPGSMTASGYPRTVRRWRRGTPMAEAETVFEGRPEDLRVFAYHDDTPGYARDWVVRATDFYHGEDFLLGSDGRLTRLDVPDSAEKSVHRDWLLVELREDWTVGGHSYEAGSLLVTGFAAFLAGERTFSVLFQPSERRSLAGYDWTRHHLLVNVLEDVRSRVEVHTPDGDGWRREPLSGVPEHGDVEVQAADPDVSDAYFMTVTDFLAPTRLLAGHVGEAPEVLKSMPAFFDTDGLATTQHFATSADGTRVPYFVVGPQQRPADGDCPTLLYGYGGFEISLTPGYSGGIGRAWLANGGVYAVANIRGGGEYGPAWHQAALRDQRERAYEDFAAVARDLIERGITRPERLGIEGGSNGGLLVGNMLVREPALFGAVVCEVPLLDMLRFHHLLAGASWIAEYGDPEVPADAEFLTRISPYHRVRPDVRYPPVLFTTSTRDDRVHPGHARKMAARMQAQGHALRYYENIEGGHGGAADNGQRAYMTALAYAFLWRELTRQ